MTHEPKPHRGGVEKERAQGGERLEMKSLTTEYRSWCGQTGCAPIGLSELLDEIENVCGKLSIVIEVGDDQRVYCVGVRLGNQVQQLPVAVH